MTNKILQNISFHIKRLLEPYGFKKGKADFILDKDNLSCVINIQKSRFSKEFTLNWGIYLPIYKEFYGTAHKPISFQECNINQRIPGLKPPGNDKWWPTDSFTSEDIEEIHILLREYTIPFFEKINTVYDIILLLKTADKKEQFYGKYCYINHNANVTLAIVYSILNQKEKSYEILDSLTNNPSTNPLYKETLVKLKEKIRNFHPSLSGMV